MYNIVVTVISNNKRPAQAFTPPTDEKKMGTIWIFACVLRRLRLTQRQMQEFLGVKLGGGSSFANMGFKSST